MTFPKKFQCFSQPTKRKFVGKQVFGIDQSLFYGFNSGYYTFFVFTCIPFMGIDNIKGFPIPFLHIDVSEAILMIASNNQFAIIPDDVGSQIQRPLLAGTFYHPFTSFPFGMLLYVLDDSVMVVHFYA